jgi:hypothetical protein
MSNTKETYEAAKRTFAKAMNGCNTIENCNSPEFLAAHKVAKAAAKAKEAAWKVYCATKPDTDEMNPNEKFLYLNNY